MKLSEISEGYRQAAVLVRFQMNEIKEQISAGHGDDIMLKQRAKALKYILGQLNDIRFLTEHYYTHPRDGKYTFSSVRARRVTEK